MKNRIHRIHRTRPTRRSAISSVTAAVAIAYVFAVTLAAGGLGLQTALTARLDRRLRSRITDVRDRGALSLEQAIVTAVLSAAAIALGVVIVNAIVNHQNQIR